MTPTGRGAACSSASLTLRASSCCSPAVVAVIETPVAKLRLFRVPELLSGSFALALLPSTASFLSSNAMDGAFAQLAMLARASWSIRLLRSGGTRWPRRLRRSWRSRWRSPRLTAAVGCFAGEPGAHWVAGAV